MKKLSVLAIPAKENKADNPYNYILYSSLEEMEVSVFPYRLRTFLQPGKYDLVHFHWPENYLQGKSKAGAWKAFAVFWLKMILLKVLGKKVVWTVHNMSPHEARYPTLLNLFYRLLYKGMDGYISLTDHGRQELVADKNVPSAKTAVIPHPHYHSYYANTISKPEARQKLGISPGAFVFLFVGQVRAYKNVVRLVEAFKEIKRPDAVLVIAGKVHRDVAAALELAMGGEDRIKLFPSFVKDEELQLYLNCADLVVNPFKKILNSGSVFLNLSFSRPSLVPATGSLMELQQKTGSRWIKTYEGELTAASLQQTMLEIELQHTETGPDLSAFAWKLVAEQTLGFYRKTLAQGRPFHHPSSDPYLAGCS